MWFVLDNDNVYPARQIRVQDFLNILTTRSAWPIRSSSASSHERFGLLTPTDSDQFSLSYEQASRVTVYADDAVLLDLLLGADDIYRNETFFRRADQNDVRSGNSILRTYVNSHSGSWFNLRLVSGTDGMDIDISNVQRFSVYTPSETQIFSRRNRGWVVSGIEIENPDIPAIESYIRVVLNIEGDSFSNSISIDDPGFDYSRIELELGHGRTITIRLTMGDETGRIFAHVSGNGTIRGDHIYSIPSWAANRLYREAENFEM
jgi:hypothetical protein